MTLHEIFVSGDNSMAVPGSRANKLLRTANGGYTRGEELLNKATVKRVQNAAAAKQLSDEESKQLAQAILEIIKLGIKPSETAAEATITKISGTTDPVVQKVLDLLAELVNRPPSNAVRCPPNSIGDAYFAGRKCGCVFGDSVTSPKFILASNNKNQLLSEYKGWKLVPLPTSNTRLRFDFVKEKYTEDNLADLITKFIKDYITPETVTTIVNKTPKTNVKDTIVSMVKAALTGVRKNTLQKISNLPAPKMKNAANAAAAAAAAGRTPQNIHNVVKTSTNNVVNKLTELVKTSVKPVNTTKPIKKAEGRTGLGGFLHKLFSGRLRFPVFGTFVLDPSNFIPQFINGIPVQWTKAKGYFIVVGGKIIRVFQRGNELVDQLGRKAQSLNVSGAIKEKIAALITKITNLAGAVKDAADAYLKALREARDASNANKAAKQEAAQKARLELLEAQRKVAEALAELMKLYKSSFSMNGTQKNININSNSIFNELYSNRFAKMSATARSKRLAELLKKHTPGSKARNIVKTRTLEEIRNAGQNRNAGIAQRRLQNLRTNIRPALSVRYNQNLMKALGVEGNRALANLKAINNYEGRGERRSPRERERGRRYENEYGRRGRGYDNYGRRGGRYENYYGRSEEGGVRRRRRGVVEEPPSGGPSSEYSNAAAAALPMNQKNAITNAGGVRPALNTVANVPGGATEVAKAAEALNETNGNVNQAVNVKGVSPAAVQAVQKLGGPKNAVNVLHGLNTLSQKTATIKRKAAVARTGRGKRRTTKPKIRVAELNRVINAVKKQKLISLVAHNVTKTHNIHPNDEKKKKYYRKVIKANILRTKFAKIVKKASKKK